jgi:hypothetical protein
VGNRKGFSLLSLLIVVAVILVVVFFISPAGIWVSESTATRALENQGFSNVQIVGRKWFMVNWRGCSNGDNVRFDATAKNPAGRQVQISVCSRLWTKGATVRSM